MEGNKTTKPSQVSPNESFWSQGVGVHGPKEQRPEIVPKGVAGVTPHLGPRPSRHSGQRNPEISEGCPGEQGAPTAAMISWVVLQTR